MCNCNSRSAALKLALQNWPDAIASPTEALDSCCPIHLIVCRKYASTTHEITPRYSSRVECRQYLQEEYYLEQSVDKAVSMDAWAEGALATSMIDDIYFVLQKCGQRAIATSNVQCVASILNAINTLLNTIVKPGLDSRWKV